MTTCIWWLYDEGGPSHGTCKSLDHSDISNSKLLIDQTALYADHKTVWLTWIRIVINKNQCFGQFTFTRILSDEGQLACVKIGHTVLQSACNMVLPIMKYDSTYMYYVGMGQIQDGILCVRYRSGSEIMTAEQWKTSTHKNPSLFYCRKCSHTFTNFSPSRENLP